MNSLGHCAWHLGLQVSVQSKFKLAKVLRSFRYAHLHAAFTFSNVEVIRYYHSKLLENLSLTSDGLPPNHNILSFEAVTYYNILSIEANSIVIIPFVQAACSTSRRTTRHTASRPKIMIPATATAAEMPATRAFSRQLVAYIAGSLPTAPYFKSNDDCTSAVCDDQYSSTLAILEETADEAFKAYMTPALGMPTPVRRCRLPRPRRRPWRRGERRWGCDASASPGTVRMLQTSSRRGPATIRRHCHP
jgi:hypothetical protein